MFGSNVRRGVNSPLPYVLRDLALWKTLITGPRRVVLLPEPLKSQNNLPQASGLWMSCVPQTTVPNDLWDPTLNA